MLPKSTRAFCDSRRHGFGPNGFGFWGTGRATAVRSTDPRCGGDFGLLPSPRRCNEPGFAMEKLEHALVRKPKGWTECERYITPRELALTQERHQRVEAYKASLAKKKEEERRVAEAEEQARLTAERAAAAKRGALEAEIQRNRAVVLSWSGTETVRT